MSTFPTSTPSYLGFTATHTLATDTHAAQHNQEQADIIALANKVGTGASTPASNLVLTASGTGTSSWSQVNLTTMVSGVLPVANGGTGTTSTTGTGSVVFSTSPTISNPTITGGGSWSGSPTILTPTIADLTNSQHNHSNAAGGGLITGSAIATGAQIIDKTFNPYKFSVYRNAAQNTGNNAFAVLQCDTKVFDTGNNVDVVTNKGRFTAPIAGFYWFSALAEASLSGAGAFGIALFKNGSRVLNGQFISSTAFATTTDNIINVSGSLQLVAGDYLEAQVFGSSTIALVVANSFSNYFQGFLVSAT